MEATLIDWADDLNMSRRKTILIVVAITAVSMVICNYTDLTIFDYAIANVVDNLSALLIAAMVAWKVGAKNVSEQWLNPTSIFHIGGWFEFLYK